MLFFVGLTNETQTTTNSGHSVAGSRDTANEGGSDVRNIRNDFVAVGQASRISIKTELCSELGDGTNRQDLERCGSDSR